MTTRQNLIFIICLSFSLISNAQLAIDWHNFESAISAGDAGLIQNTSQPKVEVSDDDKNFEDWQKELHQIRTTLQEFCIFAGSTDSNSRVGIEIQERLMITMPLMRIHPDGRVKELAKIARIMFDIPLACSRPARR